MGTTFHVAELIGSTLSVPLEKLTHQKGEKKLEKEKHLLLYPPSVVEVVKLTDAIDVWCACNS